MSQIAIQIDRLGKHYRLGRGPMGRGDFRDAVTAAAVRAGRWVRGLRSDDGNDARDLWALKDVSFEVNKGEVVGVIGHNGAGKSTLLKILSRITDPTEGRAWYEGRVGSLLEVGTGFHPELTGRENIFLSGAILGMTRREIQGKFDEIVAFSEMSRFIDTPVKRYSSGMYVRLGFAVAAHLEPEILIVDEVLAVGDASFQRKCMGKMKDVSEHGRTILFVSHNMGSIQTLCDQAIVLAGGRIVAHGTPAEAVKQYLQSVEVKSDVPLSRRSDRGGRGRTRVVDARIYSAGHADAPGLLIHGQNARIEVELSQVLPNLACKMAIYSHVGAVCRFTSLAAGPQDQATGQRRFVCEIPDLPLVPGRYRVNIALQTPSGIEDHVESALTFMVEAGSVAGRPLAPGQNACVFVPRHRWTIPRAQHGG